MKLGNGNSQLSNLMLHQRPAVIAGVKVKVFVWVPESSKIWCWRLKFGCQPHRALPNLAPLPSVPRAPTTFCFYDSSAPLSASTLSFHWLTTDHKTQVFLFKLENFIFSHCVYIEGDQIVTTRSTQSKS